MDKERKQDLVGPDEEALEQHVREMLDVNVPDHPAEETTPELTNPDIDTPSAPAVPPKKPRKKPLSIAVTHHEDDAEVPASEPAEPAADPELEAAIAATNEQLANQEPLTAPLVSKKPITAKPVKKVVITHFDETEPASTEPMAEEPQPIAVETAPTKPVVQKPESEPDPIEEEIESPLEPALESTETDKAVADIIATESDELLAMKDGTAAVAPTRTKPPKKKKRSILGKLFRTSGGRWLLTCIIFAGLVAVVIIPTARYSVLNAVGVRSSASIMVLDESSDQPLKNATVKLAGQTAQTDAEGKARLQQLKLGPTQLTVERRAFAGTSRQETIGWGSNPLGEFRLKPIGIQYTITVTDKLSGKPIANAEATLGDAGANGDDKGEIKLTLDQDADLKAEMIITAPGYRPESTTLPGTTKDPVAVSLLPAHKVAFISKRSGTYDLYSIDADSQNEKLVLEGTGNEQDNITLAPHPLDDVVMMISTRDNKRDSEGNLLSSLTLVNLKDGSTKTVIEATQIKAVDWIGSRFVYMQMATDAKPEDPTRSKLMSFDYMSGDNRQLAAANYFNDVVSAAGRIYYAPASAFQNGVNMGMFSVQADSSGKQAVFNQEVWNIFRTGYTQLTLGVQQEWYEYQLGDKPTKLAGQPSTTSTRVYVDSPDGKRSVWLENRNGKGTIISYDTVSKSERTVIAASGLKGPVRWLNNHTIVYRIVSETESADYVMSLDGAGQPTKVTDVTDTKGIDRWLY